MKPQALELVLEHFPRQWEVGFGLGRKVTLSKPFSRRKFDSLVIAGMGGSRLPALLLQTMVQSEKLSLPVFAWNSYGLPPTGHLHPLVICISYSGDTEETLSSFREAHRRKLPTIAIATGGRLAKEARRLRAPLVTVPQALAARFALGYLFGGLAGALTRTGFLTLQLTDFTRSAAHIPLARIKIKARSLSRVLQNRIPLIYTSDTWQSVGQIWKATLNETSRTPAFRYALPELNHNEMQSLVGKKHPLRKQFVALFIEDQKDHPRIQKRFTLTKEIFKHDAGIQVVSKTIEGGSFLEKSIRASLEAYWASYFLARHEKIKSIATRSIEEFKRRMGKRS